MLFNPHLLVYEDGFWSNKQSILVSWRHLFWNECDNGSHSYQYRPHHRHNNDDGNRPSKLATTTTTTTTVFKRYYTPKKPGRFHVDERESVIYDRSTTNSIILAMVLIMRRSFWIFPKQCHVRRRRHHHRRYDHWMMIMMRTTMTYCFKWNRIVVILLPSIIVGPTKSC